MRESAAWRYLEAHVPTHVEIERIEVKLPPGLADTFWHDKEVQVSGWLELKFCEPSDKEYRAGRIPKLRGEQPMWLNRWARRGVPTGILLRVGSEVRCLWKLWIATGAPEWSNLVRSVEAQANVDMRWDSGLDTTELFDVMCASRPPVPVPTRTRR